MSHRSTFGPLRCLLPRFWRRNSGLIQDVNPRHLPPPKPSIPVLFLDLIRDGWQRVLEYFFGPPRLSGLRRAQTPSSLPLADSLKSIETNISIETTEP
ncbi:hypothetical protein PSAC2689_40467 [Paraburkholderia sacchari]